MEQDTQQPQIPTPAPQPQFVVSPIEQPRSKKPLLFGLGAVTIIAAAVYISLAIWSSGAQKSYAAAAGSYKTTATAAFKAMEEQPKDTGAYIVYLEKHDTELGKVVDASPKKKTLLWASGAKPTDESSVLSLTSAVTELRAAVQQYRTFLVFRDSLLLAVKDGGGTISTPDNMRTTLAKLEKTQKDIEALRPPKGLESYQQGKVNAYKAPIADSKAALAAYDKGDADTYTKEVNELAESAKGISSVGKTADELLEMHQYYDDLSEEYARLKSLVDPEGR